MLEHSQGIIRSFQAALITTSGQMYSNINNIKPMVPPRQHSTVQVQGHEAHRPREDKQRKLK